MDLCAFSVVSVGGKKGLAGPTFDSFTSCIVGSSRTTYCLTTPTTLDHSPAPRMFNQFQWSLGADAEVSARSGPSAATSSSCSAGGRSGAPAPRPLLRIQLSASESGLDAALFMANTSGPRLCWLNNTVPLAVAASPAPPHLPTGHPHLRYSSGHAPPAALVGAGMPSPCPTSTASSCAGWRGPAAAALKLCVSFLQPFPAPCRCSSMPGFRVEVASVRSCRRTSSRSQRQLSSSSSEIWRQSVTASSRQPSGMCTHCTRTACALTHCTRTGHTLHAH